MTIAEPRRNSIYYGGQATAHLPRPKPHHYPSAHALRLHPSLREVKKIKQVDPSRIKITKEFHNVARVYQIETTDELFTGVLEYASRMKSTICGLVDEFVREKGNAKFTITLECFMTKLGGDPVSHRFASGSLKGSKAITHNDRDARLIYSTLMAEINKRVDEYEKNGSGWTLHSISFCWIRLVKYKAFAGRCYLPLPKWLQNKKCCVNVQNKDDRCFGFAVVSALAPADRDSARPSKYIEHLPKLNMEGIPYPVTSDFFEQWETQNQQPINVFDLDITDESNTDYTILYLTTLEESIVTGV